MSLWKFHNLHSNCHHTGFTLNGTDWDTQDRTNTPLLLLFGRPLMYNKSVPLKIGAYRNFIQHSNCLLAALSLYDRPTVCMTPRCHKKIAMQTIWLWLLIKLITNQRATRLPRMCVVYQQQKPLQCKWRWWMLGMFRRWHKYEGDNFITH